MKRRSKLSYLFLECACMYTLFLILDSYVCLPCTFSERSDLFLLLPAFILALPVPRGFFNFLYMRKKDWYPCSCLYNALSRMVWRYILPVLYTMAVSHLLLSTNISPRVPKRARNSPQGAQRGCRGRQGASQRQLLGNFETRPEAPEISVLLR